MPANNQDKSNDVKNGEGNREVAHHNDKPPIKRVMVPLDGSSLAEMALPHAIALAQATAGGLLLVRVVPPMNVILPLGNLVQESAELWELYEEQPAFARNYLHEVAERLSHTQLDVETYVSVGMPADLIVKYAQEHSEIVAITMSTHGRSGVGLWLFGSVAEKVLHSAPVPLMLVRPKGTHDEPEMLEIPHYRTLLIPLDGSELAAQALDQAQVIAAASGGRLVLLAVATTPFDLKLVKSTADADWSTMPWYTPAARMTKYLDGVIQELAAKGIPVEAQVTYGDVADEILKAARFVDADLIVMSTRGLGGLGRLMLGSVATRVAQSSNIPLLLIRAVNLPKKQDPAPEGTNVAGTLAIV